MVLEVGPLPFSNVRRGLKCVIIIFQAPSDRVTVQIPVLVISRQSRFPFTLSNFLILSYFDVSLPYINACVSLTDLVISSAERRLKTATLRLRGR